MTERWQTVSGLFERALALPKGERDRFLAEECGGDEVLAAEVRSLLGHHDQATGFLEYGPGGAMASQVPRSDSSIGAAIGAWRVVRPLGEGGMGVVLLVERAEGGFQQRGALKQLRHGLGGDQLVRRFMRERQILATLEHPNNSSARSPRSATSWCARSRTRSSSTCTTRSRSCRAARRCARWC